MHLILKVLTKSTSLLEGPVTKNGGKAVKLPAMTNHAGTQHAVPLHETATDQSVNRRADGLAALKGGDLAAAVQIFSANDLFAGHVDSGDIRMQLYWYPKSTLAGEWGPPLMAYRYYWH